MSKTVKEPLEFSEEGKNGQPTPPVVETVVQQDEPKGTAADQAETIKALEAEVKALEELLAKQLKAMNAGVEPVARPQPAVETKTLVQDLSTVTGYNTTVADRELKEKRETGWDILDISVVTQTEGEADCLMSRIVRVVTLEKQETGRVEQPVHEAKVATPPHSDDEGETETQTVAPEKPVVISIAHPQEPKLEPVSVTIHPPVTINREPQPRTISFAEALADPHYSAADVAAIGDREAFNRGQACYEGLRNHHSNNAHFGGMRKAGVEG